MPTRDRIINIIDIIIASNGGGSGSSNHNSNHVMKAQVRAYWRRAITRELARWSVQDWGNWCAGYLGYGRDEWVDFFLTEGDYTIQAWTAWILAHYDRQARM